MTWPLMDPADKPRDDVLVMRDDVLVMRDDVLVMRDDVLVMRDDVLGGAGDLRLSGNYCPI